MLKVQIKVKTHLDPHWSQWLECMSVEHTDDNKTVLTGTVPDEAALYGVLTKCRNLGLALVSVSTTELSEAPAAESRPNEEDV